MSVPLCISPHRDAIVETTDFVAIKMPLIEETHTCQRGWRYSSITLFLTIGDSPLVVIAATVDRIGFASGASIRQRLLVVLGAFNKVVALIALPS
jgi:hypothetical protein